MYLDGTRVVERIIGKGGMGIVVQQGQYALKIPRIFRDIKEGDEALRTNRRLIHEEEGDYDEHPDLIRWIEDEKAIYKRLGDHPGIVRCYNPSSTHHYIQMALMKNGDLEHYLAEKRPGKKTQLSWLSEMAHTIAYIHNRRVIVVDIRLPNLLLDDDLAVKFVDFSESTLMPLDWSLDGSDDDGHSILTDIGQFGAVMFEIVTGQSCIFDITEEWKEPGDLPTWPRRDRLPSTSDVWLGHIIEKCWTQGFRSANDLAAELSKEVAQSSE